MSKIAKFLWNIFFNIKRQGLQGPRPACELDISSRKRILAVSSTAIGDTLFATPALRALRNLTPKAEVDLMARDKFVPMFRRIPHISDIIPYAGSFREAFTVYKTIKDKKYDICIVFHDSDTFPVQAAWLAGIPFIFRIGQRDEHVASLLSARLEWKGHEHAIEHRLCLLEKITGKALNNAENVKMELTVSENETSTLINAILSQHGLTGDDIHKKIGFQLKASGKYKTWPSENFAELAVRLAAVSDKTLFFLMGSPAEQADAEETAIDMQKKGVNAKQILNMAGKIRIEDIPVLIKGLDLLVTNDTGPLHVAIAVRTPTVSLFVPTHAERTGPLQDNDLHTVIRISPPCHDCIEKYCRTPDCMSLITVDNVFDAVISSTDFIL